MSSDTTTAAAAAAAAAKIRRDAESMADSQIGLAPLCVFPSCLCVLALLRVLLRRCNNPAVWTTMTLAAVGALLGAYAAYRLLIEWAARKEGRLGAAKVAGRLVPIGFWGFGLQVAVLALVYSRVTCTPK